MTWHKPPSPLGQDALDENDDHARAPWQVDDHCGGRRPGGHPLSTPWQAASSWSALRRMSKEMERKMCETPTQKDLVEKTILEGIKGIAKEISR